MTGEQETNSGTLQGWIRLGLSFLAIASAMFWAVAEIKSDIRELDARLSGRIDAVGQRFDDFKAVSDQNQAETRRRLNRLEDRP